MKKDGFPYDTITDTNGPPYIFFSLHRELLDHNESH